MSTDNVTPIRPGADAGAEKADAWFHSLPVSEKRRVLDMAEALARGEKLTPALIDEIGGSIRRDQAKLADRELAMDEIIDAEALLDLLLTLVDVDDENAAGIAQTLGVVDEHTPRNTLRALQRHLKRAREALIRADG